MTGSLLELQLHLTNGHTHRFEQNDPQEAHALISQINAKVFTQPNMIVVGANSVVTYPGSAVAGISLLMEPLPDDLLALVSDNSGNLASVWEITEDEFRAKQRAVKQIVEGEAVLMLCAVEMSGGHHFWLENHVSAAISAIEERQLVHHFFTKALLPCRNLEGGISIWNRAQILSFTFYPRPSVPANALSAERISD